MNTSDKIYLPRRRLFPGRIGDVPRDGLSMWHDYTQNRGSTAQDLSGTGNDGNDNSGTIAGTPKLPFFDGVDDKITVANHASLQFGTGDFAIHVWQSSQLFEGTLVAKDDVVAADEWAFAIGTALIFVDETVLVLSGSSTLLNKGLFFCSYIRVGGLVKLYVNARIEDGPSASTTEYDSGDDMIIGNDASNHWFRGFIYQVYIYKKTYLSFQDAEQDMNIIYGRGLNQL